MHLKRIILAVIVVVLLSPSLYAQRKYAPKLASEPAPKATPVAPHVARNIAIGDVDAGHDMSGGKAWQVKEAIQIGLKRELENMGHSVKITSPAVVTGGESDSAGMPTMPTGRIPTQKEMADYMAAMQRWQKIQSGELKVHKPVAADAFFEFKVQSGKGGADTGSVASTIGRFTGIDTSLGDVSTSTTKLYLVCDMRDPATGTLEDRYTAKVSSVKFRNLGGISSYDYGDDHMARERLFSKAVKKCAKWIDQKVR